MPSLADKLQSLGVKTGREIPLPSPVESHPIESAVRGSFRATPRGDAFVAERVFDKDYLHGETSHLIRSPLFIISEWANDPRLAETSIEKFAFLDAETSGLSGGTGTYAFLVGVGRFNNSEFILRQFFMRDPSEEPAMLEALIDFLAPCKAVVSFNGKAFDVPLLAARYTLRHIPFPLHDYAHLDLLPLARRLWRDRLPSRALKYLEEHILGFTRASEETPGYEIPWLYFDYLRSGDARPLAGVFYHNAMDIVAMAALLGHISDLFADPYQGRVAHGVDFIALAKLYEDLHRWDEAARLFERGLEAGLEEADFNMAVKRLSILQKKRGNLEEALSLWEEAAERGHLYAYIELAKFYEHKRRDPKAALQWARSARKKAEQADLPLYIRKHWLTEIDHRLERLERKAHL